MYGLGTIINVGGIIFGGLFGLLFGSRLTERFQDTLGKASGISVILIGLAGALSKMLSVAGDGALDAGQSMLVVITLVLGAFVGELINLDEAFERFGEWLKQKTGKARDAKFVDGFVTASLTVCIGAMAIVGSIQDGIFGDWSILATKAVLDFIIIMVMTCSLGKGCIFSALPVGIFQGSITLFAKLIRPIMTEAALFNLSMVGSILIFCVGLNLVWGKKIKVANLLPAVIFAVLAAFLPWF